MKRAIVVGLALVGLVGCGDGKHSSPTATFNAMVTAAKAGNQEEVKACFTKATRTVAAVVDLSEKAKTAKIVVGAEKIDGQKATLEVTIDDNKVTIAFAKEEGEWRIDPLSSLLDALKKGASDLFQKGLDALKGIM